MDRASELLARSSPTDLERRIVTALRWAGRARVEHRRDEAFLFCAIALEALMGKATSRAGVTKRVRLRVTRLLGLLPEARKEIFTLMGPLYDQRSEIVHTGDSSRLADADIEIVRIFVNRAITGLLTDKRFTRMRTCAELDEWFEKDLVSNPPGPSGF
jgi:hypothetical protein